ncbi:hypothetical protein GA0070213_105357 [Micromonospora humi]|uniref:Uncharacterized protein n=1 Tax=Micromonospora humi TaxID=745366 RepID=A0A1C5IEK2_9ACTN|nr:hypothetical protein [Micromonospora humi]SCG56605.1 hypothetical protein GA0070213_105357 [Micromonospora humi]
MSYPDRAAPRRPATVVAAVAVLLLMAVGAVAYAATNLAVAGGTVERFRAAAAETDAGGGDVDRVAGLLRGSTVLAAVLGVLAAALLVGLALGLFAGRPGARVATWVVAGLGLLCGCCGLAVLVGQRAAPLRLGADDRVTADLLGLAGDAYPAWWIPVNAALSVAQILGYLVVAALLTLPSANHFLHRHRPSAGRPPGPPTGYGATASGAPVAGPTPWGPPPGLTSPSAPPASAPPPASTPPAPPPPPSARPSTTSAPPPPSTPAAPPPAGPPSPPEDRA